MVPPEKEPTPDQLRAMAYVDGELASEERAPFEARLAREPALAREVAELRGLAVLARQIAPPEPQDHEWARIRGSAGHRLLTRGGGALLALGLAALAALALLDAWGGGERPVAALLLGAGVTAVAAGSGLLVAAAVRWRLRNLPYDPYVHVRR